MDAVAVDEEISILVHDIHAHLQNLTSLSRPAKPLLAQWGATSYELCETGVVLLLTSAATSSPLRHVLGAVAAALAAGNIVVLASLTNENPFMSFVHDSAHKYMHPQTFFFVRGVSVEITTNTAVDRCLVLGTRTLSSAWKFSVTKTNADPHILRHTSKIEDQRVSFTTD